uniref:hypothetical protein n=1 Tax=Flavobacterium sp. TaxID=239 RepID=UPI00404A3193
MKNRIQILYVTILIAIFGCNSQKEDFVFEKFKSELEKKGVKIDSIDEEEIIYINVNDNILEISLENTRRNYERDADESHVFDLVNTVISYENALPTWEVAKEKIYVQLFATDFDLQNSIIEKVTNKFSKGYVISENDKLTWISKEILNTWNINETELKNQANSNANRLLSETEIKYEIVEDRKLGLIDVENSFLKGSLLFASDMKEKIKADIGFPFYAVIPVRDFCYIFSEKDMKFFSMRIGEVVVDEYKKSGNPVTTEILKFTESGVEVVGKYTVD